MAMAVDEPGFVDFLKGNFTEAGDQKSVISATRENISSAMVNFIIYEMRLR